jgi:hypothetical protein
MSGAIPPLSQYAFMAWYLVKKHRDNFTFYLYALDSRTVMLVSSAEAHAFCFVLIILPEVE